MIEFNIFSEQDGPKERPKLKLQPRSKPKENASGSSERSSSIFGSAKPVDTAAREREIENRLRKEKEDEQNRIDRDRESQNRDRERDVHVERQRYENKINILLYIKAA